MLVILAFVWQKVSVKSRIFAAAYTFLFAGGVTFLRELALQVCWLHCVRAPQMCILMSFYQSNTCANANWWVWKTLRKDLELRVTSRGSTVCHSLATNSIHSGGDACRHQKMGYYRWRTVDDVAVVCSQVVRINHA